MGDVVSLVPNGPYATGMVRCLDCGHKHVSVAPIGVRWQECPACHTHKATWVYTLAPRASSLWQCNCGCDMFYVLPKDFQCVACGVIQTCN